MCWILKATTVIAIHSSIELDKKIEASSRPVCLNVITNNFIIIIIMITIYLFIIQFLDEFIH